MNRVAGCVVLFNPANDTPTAVNSYRTQVDRLWVIDNSPSPNAFVVAALTQHSNVVYIENRANRGIAHALNQAADAATVAGFDWLLTMDQDTTMPPAGVARLLAFAHAQPGSSVGIVAGQSESGAGLDTVRWVPFVITSGNLLRLSAYRATGPFLDVLFIDWVDHEFCLRLRATGYQIAVLDAVVLQHRLGQIKTRRLGGQPVLHWVSHGPERGYYKVRNILFVSWLHKSLLPTKLRWLYWRELGKVVLKSVLLEDQKRYRLRLLTRALADARARRLGPLPDPIIFSSPSS